MITPFIIFQIITSNHPFSAWAKQRDRCCQLSVVLLDFRILLIRMEKEVTVVYNKFCPFAQRALIVALEKQVPATFRKVSLGEKGDFFQGLYSKATGRDPKSDGKVPILVHGDTILTESEVVCWYLAETFTGGSHLIPQDPLQRAKMRLMLSKEGARIIELFSKPKNGLADIEAYKVELKEGLSAMQQAIGGEYLIGDQISLADVLLYPWFERWVIVQHYFGVAISEAHPKIKAWLARMSLRPSIVETRKLTTPEYYISRSMKMMTAKL